MLKTYTVAMFCLAASQVGFSAADVQELDKDFVWYCESDEATEAQKATVSEIYFSFGIDQDKVGCKEALKLVNESALPSLIISGGSQITDLSPLAGLKHINVIICNVCSQNAFDTIPPMPSLEILDFSRSELTSLTDLDRFPNIVDLRIESTAVSDIKEIEKFTALEELSLDSTKVSDLSALKGLKNLKSLNISELDASVLGKLPYLNNLELLWLVDMGLKEVPNASQTPNLKELELGRNNIESLEGVKAFKKLKALGLSFNPISNIDSNDLNTDLAELYLVDVPLNSYKFLQHFKDLDKLSIGFSETVTWKDIDQLLPRLSWLSLLGSRIGRKEIPENTVEQWKNMKELFLDGTDVESLAFFKQVEAPKLEKLRAPDIKEKTEENCPTSGVPEIVAEFCKQ